MNDTRMLRPRASSPSEVAGPSASGVPASTWSPALTMTRWDKQVPWFERSNLWTAYHCSAEPSSGFRRMPNSRLKLSSLAAGESAGGGAAHDTMVPATLATISSPESLAAADSMPVPTIGASVTTRGTAWRCMFEPIRARLASSCSRNGINAVATLTVCFGETSMYSMRFTSATRKRFLVRAVVRSSAKWRLDEAVLVDAREDRQRAHQTDVRTLRGLDRADAAVVGVVHVADIEAGALTRKAAGPQRREAPLVGQLRQRVGLVHELRQLAGPEELLDRRHHRAGVVDRRRVTGADLLVHLDQGVVDVSRGVLVQRRLDELVLCVAVDIREQLLDLVVPAVAEGPDQGGDRDLPLAVDLDRQDVLARGLDLQPGTPIGDQLRRIEHAAGGAVLAAGEIDAR